MTKERLFGLLRLSLAHHPVCWQYRNHTIKIFSIKFCLGCTGFYSGLSIATAMIFFTSLFSNFSWFDLVLLSFVFYLPTILRILSIPLFKTSNKHSRIFFRFLLGFGVVTGLLSIFIMSDIIIQIFQILLGLGLYSALTVQRIKNKDLFKECETCSFERSHFCPGFRPFYPKEQDIIISSQN
jgi:phosphatidylserine synthase